MRYFIKTFGCQMNHSDSERIAGFLDMEKLSPADDIQKSDLAIFNTCGVRQMAEDRIYGQIHNLRKNNPRTKIILTGCLADRKDVRKRLRSKVDLFCGIKDFPTMIKKMIGGDPQTQAISGYFEISPRYSTKHTAYVPVMTGCNNFCAYCVVPYARGREVSRPAKDILKEIKSLSKDGYKEIILLGQNVNSYKDGKIDFPRLLKKADATAGKFWLWFVSNHPKDFSDELIETMAKCRKVSECVHLPIQAGSDEIIRRMNRQYTSAHYLRLIRKIRAAFKKYKPGKPYAITSDIIVGFPGETKKQFMESAKVMEKVRYDMVYFGQFSPRPGTAAWNMKDDVAKAEKEKREKFLNEILKESSFKNNRKYEKKVLEVLITSQKNGSYFGHTRTYKNVRVASDQKGLVGKVVKVKITKANTWNLEGKI